MNENQEEDMDLGQDPTSKDVSAPEVKDPSEGIHLEKEHVLFARVLDFKQFAKATRCEKIEQWQVHVPRNEENAAEGGIRIRKSTDIKGQEKYTMTVKIRKDDTKFETEVESNESMFAQMKFLANGGMIKDRYTFETQEGNWEVDLVPDGKGGYFNWVRIELETDDLSKPLPVLPIQAEEVILPEGLEKNLSEEERKQKVDQLYDSIFVVKNAYLDRVAVVEKVEETENPGQDTDVVEPAPEVDPTADDATEEKPESQEETKVTADDITSDPEKAEQTEEKAEEVEKEKQEEDENTDDEESTEETSDEDQSEGDSNDSDASGEQTEDGDEEMTEQQALKQATEALKELGAVYELLKGNTQFDASQRVYIDSRIVHARNQAGIPAMNAALEDLAAPSHQTFKTVSMEGVIDSIVRIVKAFGRWFSDKHKAVVDWFRNKARTCDTTFKRADERYRMLLNGRLIAEEGRVVHLNNLNLLAIDGNFVSFSESLQRAKEDTLHYVDQYKRKEVYQDLSTILRDGLFINEHAKNFELWGRVLKTEMVPTTGFVLAGKNASHELWQRHTVGNRVLEYQKPIVFFPGSNDYKFSVKPIPPSQAAPREVTLDAQMEYENIYKNIMAYARETKVEIEKRASMFRQVHGPIFETVEVLVDIDKQTGEHVYEEVYKHSQAIIDMATVLCDFIEAEMTQPLSHFLDVLNNTINVLDNVLEKK